MASIYSGRMRMVTYLTPAAGEYVEQRAAETGASVSSVVCELVETGIEHTQSEAQPAQAAG